MIALCSGQCQVPLAPGAAKGRNPDDAERAEQERAHRERHGAANAIELADCLLVRRHLDRARTEEERDLAHRVHGDVEPSAEDAAGGRERSAEHDVGELAHRRVGEPGLEVVSGERDDRGDQDRCGGYVHQPGGAPALREQVDPDHVDDDLQHGEDTRFYHRDRVQQRAHGCRRDHRCRQPAVKRHERRLADAERVQGEQRDGGPGVRARGQDPAGSELEGPGELPGPDDGKEQE